MSQQRSIHQFEAILDADVVVIGARASGTAAVQSTWLKLV
jgi:hypothetical protein